MKTHRLAALTAVLLAAASASAQDRTNGPAIKKREVSRDQYDQLRDGSAAKTVSSEETLRHGDLLTIRRKNGTVNGVLVYQDAKNDCLVVRTRPGTAPVAIPMKEIDEIDRIVPASATGGDKGGIRFADNSAEPRRGNYEIQTIDIFNGPVRTTHYYSPTLSPAERVQLDALERAADRQAWDTHLAQRMADRVERGPERLDLSPLMQGGGVDASFASASFTTSGPFAPFNAPFYASSPGAYGYGGGGAGLALLPALLSQASRPAPAVIEIPKNNETQADLVKALRESQDALSKSRQEYTTAASRAVLDNEGRIVAVRLEEK